MLGMLMCLLLLLRFCCCVAPLGIFNRRHCELDNPKLYAHSLLGTKHAIEQYLEEVEASLAFLCDTTFYTWRQKKSIFKQAQRSLGSTALCLSGGGALALCHAGVVQELLERGCLPSVTSGTSGGSIIAGYMACHTDAELLSLINPYVAGAHGMHAVSSSSSSHQSIGFSEHDTVVWWCMCVCVCV
jgi:patatin-like phospholipase/uncharacterized protein DUF3336